MKCTLKSRVLAAVVAVAVLGTTLPAVVPVWGATNLVTGDGSPVVTTEWWLATDAAPMADGVNIRSDIAASCGGGAALGAAVKRGLNVKATSLLLYGFAGALIYVAWQGSSSTRAKVTTGLTCATIAHELVKKPGGSTEAAKTSTSTSTGGGAGKKGGGVPK